MDLLDVNVLIALLDPAHIHHAEALSHFRENAASGWATCPLTENGLLRILGHARYPGGPGSPGEARVLLNSLRSMSGHQFWPDSVSLCSTGDLPRLPDSRNLTDLYLLSLAVSHDARLVTLDRRIDPTFVAGGARSYFVLNPNLKKD